MQKINRGTIFPLYPDRNTVSMAANIVILEWMEQSQTPSAWFLKLIAKSTMKEHRQKSCFILTLLGKTSLHQLERLQCSEWCRELNNQADTLTGCQSDKRKQYPTVSGKRSVGRASPHILISYFCIHIFCGLSSLCPWAALACTSPSVLGGRSSRCVAMCAQDAAVVHGLSTLQHSSEIVTRQEEECGFLLSASLIANLCRAYHGKTDASLKAQKERMPEKRWKTEKPELMLTLLRCKALE